jgi:hypothetical protein
VPPSGIGLDIDRGHAERVLWYIIWYIAPRAAGVIGFDLKRSCRATFRSRQGLNKHHLRGVIPVRIFFKRRRLRQPANHR